ncbi:MAG: LysR family glycine cleavage system transcriptional activator [Gammaproteobacteria bacterium]|jgi:LysR family glycine cleavage system transcriptional activator
MSRRLPPLNALRAFESAGRHLSMSKAAEELGVTPAAVSHQVKALEAHLGVALFRRLNKALLLTDAGQACLPRLRKGFEILAEAINDIDRINVRRPLTVSVTPSFGGKWLVPRLDRFREQHPTIDVRIDATTRLVDFTREQVDLAIRYGPGREPGLRAYRMMREEIFPVCSPALLQGAHALHAPQALAQHTLLHVDSPNIHEAWPDWQMWLLTAGVAGVDTGRGPRFTQPSMAVQAATEGHGVALGSSVLVNDDLKAGRLVKPFDLSFPVNFAYHVVLPEGLSGHPNVRAFRDWLLVEANSSSDPA